MQIGFNFYFLFYIHVFEFLYLRTNLLVNQGGEQNQNKEW